MPTMGGVTARAACGPRCMHIAYYNDEQRRHAALGYHAPNHHNLGDMYWLSLLEYKS